MSFDLQPDLSGDRLYLRPLRAEDYEGLFAAARDPLIWEQHPQKDRHEPAQFKRFFDDAIASKGALAIIDKSTHEIIGSSRFHGFDAAAREIEIGWTFLTRRYWGGGYNGEAKALMLQHAFNYVDHVVFLIGSENRRSQKAVEKLGARFVGERENCGGASTGYVYRISVKSYAG